MVSPEPAVHGRQGTRPSIAENAQESQRIRDVRLWDTDGDGVQEIIAARDLDGKRLIVCDWETRKPVWLGNVGGRPYGLAVREHDGEREILCASFHGYVHAFRGLPTAAVDRAMAVALGRQAPEDRVVQSP